MSTELSVVKTLKSKDVIAKFTGMLGDKTPNFMTSLIQVVSDSKLLAVADPMSVINSAATAAALNLPISKHLGFSWIVGYKTKGVVIAQYQIGWKGFVQMALRTGQYKTLNAVAVYSSQYKSFNAMTEVLRADFTIEPSGVVVGYVGYFKLMNGFEKTVYWSKEKVTAHGKKYSKSFGFAGSVWKTDFDSMALKTVIKNMLSKWGILSIEMETAMAADQSSQTVEGKFEYVDNEPEQNVTISELNKSNNNEDNKEKSKPLVVVEIVQETGKSDDNQQNNESEPIKDSENSSKLI